MGAWASFWRLHHAARVLARHDALIPREYLDGLPVSLRMARRLLESFQQFRSRFVDARFRQ